MQYKKKDFLIAERTLLEPKFREAMIKIIINIIIKIEQLNE